MDTPIGQSTLGEMLPFFIIIPILLFIVVFCFIMAIKTSKEMKQNKLNKSNQELQLQQMGVMYHTTLKHADGLPLPLDVNCEVLAYQNHIQFQANGLDFNLERQRITDISIKTDVEIQSQYVSSVGGAVGGAILFGGLGAIVGGRAKQKQTTTRTHYLIFTYTKDNEVKYISFETPAHDMVSHQFKVDFQNQPRQNQSFNL